jgi:hypothetical protein
VKRQLTVLTPRPTRGQLWSVLDQATQWTRQIMMDFGFQSFLDKFEERLGTRHR